MLKYRCSLNVISGMWREKIFRFIVSNFLLRFSIACLKSIQIVWSRYHSSLWFLNMVCFAKNIQYLIRYIKITKLRQPEKISFKYLIKGDITILNLPTEEEKNLTIIMSEHEVYHSSWFIWINRYWFSSIIYELLFSYIIQPWYHEISNI